jgi:prepilin-type N-terminal cleavage/methylation domain-containing protein
VFSVFVVAIFASFKKEITMLTFGGNTWRSPQRSGRGFTLIELLVVIAIIGILAAMVMGGVTIAQRKAREAQVRTDLTGLYAAIESFKFKFGEYPSLVETEGLFDDAGRIKAKLIRKFRDEKWFNFDGSQLPDPKDDNSYFLDPYGNNYRYYTTVKDFKGNPMTGRYREESDTKHKITDPEGELPGARKFECGIYCYSPGDPNGSLKGDEFDGSRWYWNGEPDSRKPQFDRIYLKADY